MTAVAHVLVFAEHVQYEAGADPVLVAVSITGNVSELLVKAQEHADKQNHRPSDKYPNSPLSWKQGEDGCVVVSSSIGAGYGEYYYYVESAPLIDEPALTLSKQDAEDLLADLRALRDA